MKAVYLLLQKLNQSLGLALAILLAFIPLVSAKISQTSDWFRTHTTDIGFHLVIATTAHMITDAFYAIVHIVMHFIQ